MVLNRKGNGQREEQDVVKVGLDRNPDVGESNDDFAPGLLSLVAAGQAAAETVDGAMEHT